MSRLGLGVRVEAAGWCNGAHGSHRWELRADLQRRSIAQFMVEAYPVIKPVIAAAQVVAGGAASIVISQNVQGKDDK